MKIRTQFIISVAVFGTILIVLAVFLSAATVSIRRYNQQEGIANNIQRTAGELSYAANNYLLYGESQQRARWESAYESLSTELSSLTPLGPEEQAIVNDIKTNMERLKTIFAEASATIERASQTPGSFFERSFIQISWSRMQVQNETIIFGTSRLFSMIDGRLDDARLTSTRLLAILVGAFGVYLFINYLLLYRRTLKSISELTAGTKVIGSGNLEHVVPAKRTDEVGDLARAFNHMTANLKSVTTSKSDLEREIAERNKVEASLTRSERHLAEAQHTAHIGSWEWDLATGRMQMSDEWYRIIGDAPQSSTPTFEYAVERMHPDDRRKVQEQLDGLLARGTASYEHRVVLPDGAIRHVATNSMVTYDESGKPISVTGTLQDITERKRTEESLRQHANELEAANKELEAFSYSVSHDLKSPLRTLDSFSEALIDDYKGKIDETGLDYLNRIRKASQTMSRLIDDMLRLSRIIRTEMRLHTVDISEQARLVALELQQSQPERKVEFVIAPGMVVTGDRQLLQICLRNLLENSWKFTAKNGEALIEFGMTRQHGENVYFIKDNGVGFDMTYSDKLFQPFQRLHSSKEYPGTGIGLAIVQRIVSRHGGRIRAESEAGKGATFFFTLGGAATPGASG